MSWLRVLLFASTALFVSFKMTTARPADVALPLQEAPRGR